jgi:hypothetical protein
VAHHRDLSFGWLEEPTEMDRRFAESLSLILRKCPRSFLELEL